MFLRSQQMKWKAITQGNEVHNAAGQALGLGLNRLQSAARLARSP